MKWSGYWYGIELEPEDEEDEKLLNKLMERLKKEPSKTYDGGEIEFIGSSVFFGR